MNRPIRTTTDLIRAAAECLIARDGDGLERLLRINDNWLQSAAENDAQRLLLTAMREAAELLDGEPSELEDQIEDERDDDDEAA